MADHSRIEGRRFVDRGGERSHAIGSATGIRTHPERLDQLQAGRIHLDREVLAR